MILNLASGHWFFQEYDRLTRTPRPEEIAARTPPVGILVPTRHDIPRFPLPEPAPSLPAGENRPDARNVNHAVVQRPDVPPVSDLMHNNNDQYTDGRSNLQVVRDPNNPMRVVIHQSLVGYHHHLLDHRSTPTFFPREAADHANLIRSFRHEILRDWMNDLLQANGLGQFQLRGRGLDYAEIDVLIRNWAVAHDRPYAVPNDIKSHGWDPETHNCTYHIVIGNFAYDGTAEELEPEICGLRYATWTYWSFRPGVHQRCVVRFMEANGYQGWFKEIMWHYLPLEEFLRLWRQRRASRSG